MAPATMIGLSFLLQVVGMLVVVGASAVTAWKMHKYGAVSYDQLGPFLNTVGSELRNAFVTQAIGFIIAVAGMTMGAYASLS